MNFNTYFPMYTKKPLGAAVLLCSMGVASGQQTIPPAQENRKNVIMILVDDLKPALGCYGDKIAVSPNIDKLAQRGVRFNKAYCNQAVCMASRYNLLLGSRSTSTGLFNFGTEFRDVYPNAITLPQLFMNAGYHAEAMGKYTMSDMETRMIKHHGASLIIKIR